MKGRMKWYENWENPLDRELKQKEKYHSIIIITAFCLLMGYVLVVGILALINL